MKKLIVIAIAFVSLQTFAQQPKKGELKEMKRERAEMMRDLSPEEMATISTKKMTLALDLTEKQQADVKKVLLEVAKDKKAKRDAHQKMTKEERQTITKEERVKRLNAQLDQEIVVKQKMKAILNAEQYEKWEKIQERRLRKSKDRFKDRPKH